MNSTLNTSEGIKREEGQKQLLEKNLQAHRNKKWIINFVCAISFLLAIVCLCFQVPKAIIITVILLFTCVTFQIAHKTLDRKIELRLKRIKQDQRKSMFKIK
ncbi:hypothetical protein [Priestia megaterium]|uniref:hypothetical protein n=1 Tax=Priestia megaterium TaxID=1404 RepID=UPI002E23B69C|nr:hypothetical protein [Priestia megaterium]